MRANSPNSRAFPGRIARAIGALLLVLLVCAPLYAERAPRDFVEGPPAKDKEAIQHVLDGVARAYGGREALRSIESVYALGTITYKLRGERGRYEHYFQRPGRFRVDTRFESVQERRLLNGAQGWSAQGGGPFIPATVGTVQQMIYQYNGIDLALGMIEGRYGISYLGEADLGGRDAYILGIAAPQNLRLEVFVDMKSSLIVKIRGYFNVNKIRAYITSEYSDFRWVGETVMPHRILNYGSGRRMGETLIEEYRINPPIGDEVFKP